jgi:hypothetical protein
MDDRHFSYYKIEKKKEKKKPWDSASPVPTRYDFFTT